jgi:deazaflavin-dependent oxidoreductase (nitroreductase family)
MRSELSTRLHTIVQKFAASRAGSRFLSRTLHHFDRFLLKLTGGRRTLTAALAGVPVVMLTTKGAKTGLPRSTPLLPIRDLRHPERFALVASNWGGRHHPAWYFNLKAHPLARCTMDGQARRFIAYEATGDEYAGFWTNATRTYFGFRLYQQRAGSRHIPIMVMTPLTESSKRVGVRNIHSPGSGLPTRQEHRR